MTRNHPKMCNDCGKALQIRRQLCVGCRMDALHDSQDYKLKHVEYVGRAFENEVE